VVPGVGTLPPDQWSDGSGDFWLRSIRLEYAYDVGIFSFPNELAANSTPFSCQQVESQGADFLAALYGLTQTPEVELKPRDFITPELTH
jgi:hypothetical protein